MIKEYSLRSYYEGYVTLFYLSHRMTWLESASLAEMSVNEYPEYSQIALTKYFSDDAPNDAISVKTR